MHDASVNFELCMSNAISIGVHGGRTLKTGCLMQSYVMLLTYLVPT